MSGIKFDKPKIDVFSFKEREKKIKRSMTFKFIVLIILTNSFTYLSFSSPNFKESKEWTTGKNHKRVIIPIKMYSELNVSSPTQVSLYTSKNRLIIKSIYIIKRLQHDESINDSEEITQYLIEVHEKQLNQLIKRKDAFYLAYPLTKLTKIKSLKKPTKVQRKKVYEIIL